MYRHRAPSSPGRLEPTGAMSRRAARPRLRIATYCTAWLIALLLIGTGSSAHARVAVISHEGLAAMDQTVIGRIFTGRMVQVGGTTVQPVNLRAGDRTRGEFLRAVLQQSDDDYVAYWIVRRSIGRGTPPPEMEGAREVMAFVQSTPGAVGYVDEALLGPGIRVLFLLP